MSDDAETPHLKAPHLKVLRTFSVSKRDDTPNEDQWSFSPDGKICAVCDGASISFDSKPWAELLARRFTSDSEVTSDWLQKSIAEYTAAYDREAMPWMHQAAFDRGSFSTLLGVVFSEDWRAARVLAIGDTILAFVDGGQVVRTVPYVSADEFEHSPKLLSTNPFENRELELDDVWTELNIASHAAPMFLLMTDALGKWLLDQRDEARVSTLVGIEDENSFRVFVERERAEGRLKRDDTTLVIVG